MSDNKNVYPKESDEGNHRELDGQFREDESTKDLKMNQQRI